MSRVKIQRKGKLYSNGMSLHYIVNGDNIVLGHCFRMPTLEGGKKEEIVYKMSDRLLEKVFSLPEIDSSCYYEHSEFYEMTHNSLREAVQKWHDNNPKLEGAKIL